MKRCTKCGDVKPFYDFSPHKMGIGGVRSICKPCSVKAVAEYRRTERGADVSRRASRTFRATPRGAACRVEWNRRDAQANPARYLLNRARARAKRLGLPFSLCEADIVIPERCPILGVKLVVATKVFRGAGVGGSDDSMSLDRNIPHLGYVPGNVSVISWRANRMKGGATLEDLEKLVAWLRSIDRR